MLIIIPKSWKSLGVLKNAWSLLLITNYIAKS
uniref:Uncharacterized protein n=1 Tax=Lepeophtheirus salmonis TaxID=72036 RepID=A0A0K2T8Q5_LEPSM